MYRYTQETSRLLHDAGSGIVRTDIDQRRADAGETPWRQVGHAQERAAV